MDRFYSITTLFYLLDSLQASPNFRLNLINTIMFSSIASSAALFTFLRVFLIVIDRFLFVQRIEWSTIAWFWGVALCWDSKMMYLFAVRDQLYSHPTHFY